MPEYLIDQARVDRRAFAVTSFAEAERADWAYWRSHAYATAGVKECWLVLAPEKQIEVHRQPQGEQFAEHATHRPGGTLTSAAVPSLTAELDRLFAG